MNDLKIGRPANSEYAPYYEMYVSLVEGDNIIDALKIQINETVNLITGIPAGRGTHRYRDDKWSIKELLGHLIDTERIMAYRALRIARGDKTPTAGFDQDPYIENSDFDACKLSGLAREFEFVRRSNILMFGNLGIGAWSRTGIVSNNIFSTRALAYVMAGHELHHTGILKERYLAAD